VPLFGFQQPKPKLWLLHKARFAKIKDYMLLGFFIPIKVVQSLIFSSNMFLKQQIGTFKLTKLELFTIPKLT
jgi:hypothetical protein